VAGWKVALIDHRPFGGTCALRGCDPKKMLVSGEEAVDAGRRMRDRGPRRARRDEASGRADEAGDAPRS